MEKLQQLLERLKALDHHDLIRRDAEMRTIETVLLIFAEQFEEICTKMEKRIEHLEQNERSAGNDEGKKLPKRWIHSIGESPENQK